ncbi:MULTISPECIES: hypothetical protein [unclassified Haladaptatus]|nr:MULTISPECIES: hypothetical protein [unclassified Haladaptatus]
MSDHTCSDQPAASRAYRLLRLVKILLTIIATIVTIWQTIGQL